VNEIFLYSTVSTLKPVYEIDQKEEIEKLTKKNDSEGGRLEV
jgi:hypothetical protein